MLPASRGGACVELDWADLMMLIGGIDLQSAKRRPIWEPRSAVAAVRCGRVGLRCARRGPALPGSAMGRSASAAGRNRSSSNPGHAPVAPSKTSLREC